MRTTAAVVLGSVLLAGALTACSSGENANTAPATETPGATPPPAGIAVAEPAASGDQPKAITHDTKRAPAGATLATSATVDNGSTTVTLTVTGLLPNTEYGSHAHTKPCGAKAADSGPHYQDEKDPVSPSVDPAYANRDNEIWLDFTTDDKGSATSSAKVNWEFRKGEANSIVVHATHTHTDAGKAGTAGERLACLTYSF
ncbi:superoxide dismutase family protein [Lentzea kentuckyensis]|uniref:superoxide dismutase family protein n=1 Tax=Lentzea kentuckyensis TaxID=360086 RepID=UPI000A3A61A9|nr:superoxide dismutase family protein [Lentzea kentuckyensis]